ncbi:hypothetical protein AB0J42_22270 [Nonomuraea sp. NPDC049649]|uniref:hypothetical protein n=1 Tax=Nonomuraea sp. NPDC049649 TaxID=3155776 RepID=UPI00342F0D27
MQIHQGCAPHRAGPLTRLWRIRAELLLAAGAALLVLTFAGVAQEGRWLPFALLSSAVTAPVVTRSGRNRAVAHFWCVVSRHRLRRVCLETTMHTRSGRIPLVLWITPTATGEKALILTRAGICAEEFEAYAGEIAAACWARAVMVYKHRTRANLVIVEIVRRDERPGALSPGFARLYGRAWTPLRSDLEEPSDPHRLPALQRAA